MLAEGQSDAAGLVFCFFELCFGIRVGDNAGTDVVVEVAGFVNEGADGDVELRFAVEAEVADGTCVKAAIDGLEFGDDFGGTFFGRSGDGATWEAGAEGGGRGEFIAQGAADGGDEMVDVLEFFVLEHVGDLDGAEFANLAEVVAEEVGDHDELGGFFFGPLQVEGGAGVEFGVGEAGTGSFDGPRLDFASGETKEGFGRGREDFASGEIYVSGNWSGRGAAELFIERKESVGRVA